MRSLSRLPGTPLALLGLVVGCSPAAPIAQTPTPTPPVAATAKPAPAPHASWSFSSAGEANAQLQLADGSVLQVGEHGRRWLLPKAGGEPQQAATITPQDLVDARLEPGAGGGAQVLLLGEQGAVFFAKDALGEIVAQKPGPKDHKAIAFSAGKQALFGVDKAGTLHRSTDSGATWVQSRLALRAGDQVIGMAANGRGEVLVALQPQRVLVSTDDGATFAQIGTPGIGARGVIRDAKGDLFLLGAVKEQAGRLANGKLELAAPVALTSRKQGKEKRRPRVELAGQRTVTITETPEPKPSKKVKIEATIAAFGKEGTPSVLEASAARSTRILVGGHENAVVIGVHDDRADPPTTKLMRTIDDGKTWEALGTLSGRLSSSGELFVGPGQVFVGEVCDDETGSCKAAQVKDGNKPWKDVLLPPKTRLERMQIDAAHDRAWIIAGHGDKETLLVGKLSEGTFAPTKLELPKGAPSASAVDAKGNLRLAYGWPFRVLKITPEVAMTPALFASFEAQAVDLAGERGFAWDGDAAYETADGGEHWAKVPTGAAGAIACADAGCVQGQAVRVGWELPDPAKELVAAKTTAPPEKPEVSEKPAAATTDSPLGLSCTPGGAWKPFESSQWGLLTALDGDVRFVTPTRANDGSTGVVVGRGSAAPTRIALLGPKAKDSDTWRTREWTHTTNEGFVSLRYTFGGKAAEGTKYAPVDVELAWYSAATGKANKAKLPKVSPFRVGRTAPSALHAIVDGGLLFLPNSGDGALTFVKDGGKVETMPRPPEPEQGDWTDAFKKGDQIVLSYQRSGHITFARTADAGKTWSTTTWSLGAPVALGMLDGKMTLAIRSSLYSAGPPAALLSFEALTNDPPEALRIDPKKLALGSALVACTPKTRLGLPIGLERSPERRNAKMTLAPAKGDKDGPMSFELASVLDRVDGAGAACNDGLQLEKVGGGDLEALVAPHDLGHGWLLRRKDDKLEVRPLACKAE